MKVFIDTGAFYASAISSDSRNSAAKTIFLNLSQSRAILYTSDYILAETYTLLNARDGHRAAVTFMEAFDESGIKELRVSEAIESVSKDFFKKLDLPRLSFFDCTSFALINAHSLDHAFTFDRHFSFFRFNNHVTILGTT